MKDLEKSLLDVVSEQEANCNYFDEIEEVVAPIDFNGCGCIVV